MLTLRSWERSGLVQEVSFTLEILTPLFLAGADQEDAELRAPSFRGAMRYWLRALLGGLYGTSGPGLTRVWNEEKSVFGTTDQGSAVMIRLELDGLGAPETFEREHALRDSRGQWQPTGRDYLLWSMTPMGREARRYYPAGRTFTLTLSVRGQDRVPLDKDVAALWLLVYLGGLGSRSRRGAGSLAVTEVEGWDHNRLSFETPATPQAFKAFLVQGLEKARGLFDAAANGAHAQPPRFDALEPARGDERSLWVVHHVPPWIGSKPVQEALGASMRDFRNRRPPDHDNVAQWLTGRATPPTVERAAFGLPLPFRYSNGGPRGVVQSTNADRRSSPVLLRVAKLGGATPQYVGVIVLFRARLLPPGESLAVKGNGYAHPLPPPPNYSLIEQWIATFPHRLEVW